MTAEAPRRGNAGPALDGDSLGPSRPEAPTSGSGIGIGAGVTSTASGLRAMNSAIEPDVAERRMAEHRAAEDKRLLDDLLARTNTGTVVFNQDLTVLRCNDAVTRLVGRDSTERLVGRQLGELLGSEDPSELRRFFDETLRLGSLAREFETVPAAHASTRIEAHGVASVLNGRPCVMALLRNVSGRTAGERLLRQECEALSAELNVAREGAAGRSLFLAKVNHELRTPLNGIIGLSEMLRHMASARSLPGSDIRKFCNGIHESGTHLLSLVDDLIDLSQLSAGSWSINPVTVAVRAEIDAALLSVGAVAAQKRIVVENTFRGDLKWVLDQRALKQIIINLVGNALKFSPSGTRVRVEVTRSDKAMALHVCDQGPGISPEDRAKILTPFGRGRYAEEHRFDGVGLGLCIVSELLKLHGGTLAIDSEVGRGSTFTAHFPVSNSQHSALQVAAE